MDLAASGPCAVFPRLHYLLFALAYSHYDVSYSIMEEIVLDTELMNKYKHYDTSEVRVVL